MTPTEQEALCRLIDEHDAFKREVSDAWVAALSCLEQVPHDDRGEAAMRGARLVMSRFIIHEPVDPLRDAVAAAVSACRNGDKLHEAIDAEIAKRNGRIVWEIEK